jgi:hypothetical protein
VIPQNRHRGSLAYQFYALIWRPSVPDNVTKAIDLIDSSPVNIRKGRQQRLKVRMDIRNQGNSHFPTLILFCSFRRTKGCSAPNESVTCITTADSSSSMLYRILIVLAFDSSNQDTHFIVSLVSATQLT